MKTFAKTLAAALTAFLMWAAFPPMNETLDIAFALAPMLALTRLAARPGTAARWWFLSGFAFWFGTLSWMPAICRNNGPWPLVMLGWAGLAAACAGYFALFGWLDARLWARARGTVWMRVAALTLGEPLLWAGVEWMRGTLFTGFAWNFLGTAVGAVPSLAAPARLGGVYLVSALVVAVNGVFATLLVRAIAPMAGDRAEEARGGGKRWLRTLETALPLLVAWAVLQLAAPPPAPSPDAARHLRVALIQRNAPCIFSRRDAEDPFRAFTDLLDKAVPAQPDLVVLAESAFAEFGAARSDRTRHAALHFANRCGGAAVIGGCDDIAVTGGVRRVYNAAALYSPTASNALVAVYRKQHLVPFGEYIPFDKWIPPLQRLSPLGVSLHPGEPALFEVEGMRLAPLICFEDTVPPLARRAAADGAQAIVLITNDSWFSHSTEAEQHACQAVMRAVETGLPVLRVGNSGVTGVILPSGRAHWLTDGDGHPLVDQPGCQVESVPIRRNPSLTLYVRFGDWPLLTLFALALAATFLRQSRIKA